MMDGIFLVMFYEVSYDWMEVLFVGKVKVFDLLGVFCFKDIDVFVKYYGFVYMFVDCFDKVVYGLVEYQVDVLKSVNIVVVLGCYLMVLLLVLKLLFNVGLLDISMCFIINVVLGVSGVGRKVSFIISFYEVSL